MIKIFAMTALFIALSLPAIATEEGALDSAAPAETNAKPEITPAPTPIQVPATSRERREAARGYVLANYSPLDLLIFPKIGVTAGLVSSADRTWELEYLSGSYSVPAFIADIGGLNDTRVSLIARRYFGGPSFHFSYGLSYFDSSLHVGDKLLNGLSGGSYPYIDTVEIQSLGFNIAVGHRWTFPHQITLGVDWISWQQPIVTLKRRAAFLDYATNEADRTAMENGIKAISYFPRFCVAKFQFGMTF